jgi:hypothetical protein
VPDFTLCIGDDESDELMFNELKKAKSAAQHMSGDVTTPDSSSNTSASIESGKFDFDRQSNFEHNYGHGLMGSSHNLLGSSGINSVGHTKEETQGLFTCTVGLKPSNASSHLEDVSAVIEFLERISSLIVRQSDVFGNSPQLSSLQEENDFGDREEDFFCGDEDDSEKGAVQMAAPPAETVSEYFDKLDDDDDMFF